MEEENGNLENLKVIAEYVETFRNLAPFPMIQCSGENDPQYIAMLKYALKKGRAVTEEDEEKFFPMEEDALY